MNADTLPFGMKLPQPKLPVQMRPTESTVTPKPPPTMPPPVTGERAVPLAPSAGEPSGLSTTTQVAEFGVPCTVLIVIHAYPLRSKMMLPGPPN